MKKDIEKELKLNQCSKKIKKYCNLILKVIRQQEISMKKYNNNCTIFIDHNAIHILFHEDLRYYFSVDKDRIYGNSIFISEKFLKIFLRKILLYLTYL